MTPPVRADAIAGASSPHRFRAAGTLGVLGVLAAIAIALALVTGRGDLSDDALVGTLLELRALRAGAAFLAGSALAVGGVVVQGLFRNPLASPSILGTTAGASFGGQVALLVASSLAFPFASSVLLPIGAIAGALGSLGILLLFVRKRSDPLAVLLTGFVLSSLFLSLGGFLTSLAVRSYDLGRAVVSFALGGVSGTSMRHVLLAAPLAVIAMAASWFWSRPLDLLLSGEEEAQSLGLDVARARRGCIVWVALLTAAAVAVGGNVAFVGLVVPHALRPIVGASHAKLLPASVLLGGTFLVACDIVARVVPAESEIPLGVITGIVGAPLFLWLLLRDRRAP
jgi:iron complex transport system permease protein